MDVIETYQNRMISTKSDKNIDIMTSKDYNKNNVYMLSRVDERIGFMTPQQPI